MGVPNAPPLNLPSVLNVTVSAFALIFAKAIIMTTAAVVMSGFKNPFICKSSYGFPLINFRRYRSITRVLFAKTRNTGYPTILMAVKLEA